MALRGSRNYIAEKLVPFARGNPQITIRAEVKRNRLPFIRGEYRKKERDFKFVVNGNTMSIGLKNQNLDAIDHHVYLLRNQCGLKVTRKMRPVLSQNPSIQGVWDQRVAYHNMSFSIEHVDGTKP
mgnify:CR=1 FL=1